MRVILIQDVDRLGSAGDVKEVADGYGRNYLLPKGLAEFASPAGLKRAEEYRNAEEGRQQALNTEMEGLARLLDGLEINIKAKAGDKDRLYGSVTSADIAEEAQRLTGHEIDKRKVLLDEPIHQLGEYDVAVKLSRDLAPGLKVTVTSDDVGDKVDEEAETKPDVTSGKKAKKKAEVESEEESEIKPAEVAEADVSGGGEVESGEESEIKPGEVTEADVSEKVKDSVLEEPEYKVGEAAEDVSKELSE
jgi:large subunit ribosomal protein L9